MFRESLLQSSIVLKHAAGGAFYAWRALNKHDSTTLNQWMNWEVSCQQVQSEWKLLASALSTPCMIASPPVMEHSKWAEVSEEDGSDLRHEVPLEEFQLAVCICFLTLDSPIGIHTRKRHFQTAFVYAKLGRQSVTYLRRLSRLLTCLEFFQVPLSPVIVSIWPGCQATKGTFADRKSVV